MVSKTKNKRSSVKHVWVPSVCQNRVLLKNELTLITQTNLVLSLQGFFPPGAFEYFIGNTNIGDKIDADTYGLSGVSWNAGRRDLGAFTLPLLFFVSALVASLALFALLALSFSSSPELTFLQAFFHHAPSKPTQCLFTNQLWFSQDKILQIHTNLWKTAITIDPLLPQTSLQFFHFEKTTCQGIFFLLYLFYSLSFPELIPACAHSFFLKYAFLALALRFLFLCSYYSLH